MQENGLEFDNSMQLQTCMRIVSIRNGLILYYQN